MPEKAGATPALPGRRVVYHAMQQRSAPDELDSCSSYPNEPHKLIKQFEGHGAVDLYLSAFNALYLACGSDNIDTIPRPEPLFDGGERDPYITSAQVQRDVISNVLHTQRIVSKQTADIVGVSTFASAHGNAL